MRGGSAGATDGAGFALDASKDRLNAAEKRAREAASELITAAWLAGYNTRAALREAPPAPAGWQYAEVVVAGTSVILDRRERKARLVYATPGAVIPIGPSEEIWPVDA